MREANATRGHCPSTAQSGWTVHPSERDHRGAIIQAGREGLIQGNGVGGGEIAAEDCEQGTVSPGSVGTGRRHETERYFFLPAAFFLALACEDFFFVDFEDLAPITFTF